MPRDLVERLYSAPPDGFVAARTEAAREAREAGDAAGAREIAKLRKPTVAAWLVNLLALRRPDLMAELVELSTALRSAQRELRGPRLRELSAQRRGVVTALVGQARELAQAADPRLAAGKLPLAEVEATLNAALSDLDVAEQARSGRLVRAASYAGFGEVPRPNLRLIVGGPDETAPDEPVLDEITPDEITPDEAAPDEGGGAGPGRPGRKGTAVEPGARLAAEPRGGPRAAPARESALATRRRALDRALADARTRQERAEAELARATEAERDGAAALTEIETALADLERRRAAAEREVGRRKLARKTAERGAVAARRRVGDVEAAVEATAAESGR
ncbi:hypothetical protein H4W31_002617 [Plantactinospora soyae]|uniref:Uncharacterized protein n=2 Tax=Plantactinospora soyae TaxID=1544732 RepID=A0A927M3G8_9ACTN|nr:hypothetical protein [Plantactinospora soyae]